MEELKIGAAVLGLLIAGAWAWFAFLTRTRRRDDGGFQYVYVRDDGTAIELTKDEQDYLNTEFFGGDGGRPYVKFRYESLTPDSRMRGYLLRRQLPAHVTIAPAPSGQEQAHK